MMEEMVTLIAEKGIIAGAFIYMLYLFLTKFTKSQEQIAGTMLTISDTLQSINVRMELMDRRIERLETMKEERNAS